MASTRDDLDSFNQFAAERLARGDSAASLDDLFMEWRDLCARKEINQAIRRGLDDVSAGRYEPADQATESIRRQVGFAKEVWRLSD